MDDAKEHGSSEALLHWVRSLNPLSQRRGVSSPRSGWNAELFKSYERNLLVDSYRELYYS